MSAEALPQAPQQNNLHLDSSSSAPAYTNGNAATLQNAKDSIISSTKSAMETAANHPATQQVKDTVVNGPVGQTVKGEAAKTSSEFKDLADSRTVPEHPAATGQPLTHYHSLFYRLLSWKNPRATAISFASVVLFIFAARYLNVLSYSLKAVYSVLGVTALAETVGKAAFGTGFATQMRPKRYFTIRKESLERVLDDIEQLINFIVIEFQRVLFVENIWATAAAFVASFLSYWLIKWLPLWGLSLLATSITFLGPLVYLKNQELIDAHIDHAGTVINAQASQVRDLAAEHTTRATETVRSYAGEYTQKAQGIIGQARGRATGSPSPTGVKPADLPNAPKQAPFPTAPHHDPAAAAPVFKAEPTLAH